MARKPKPLPNEDEPKALKHEGEKEVMPDGKVKTFHTLGIVSIDN